MKHLFTILALLTFYISHSQIPLYQLETADTTDMVVVTYKHPSGDYIQKYVHKDSLGFGIDSLHLSPLGLLTMYTPNDSIAVDLVSLHQQYSWVWSPTSTGKVNITRRAINGNLITEQFHLEPRNIEVSGSEGVTLLSVPNGKAWEDDDSRTLHQIDVKNRFRTFEVNDSTLRVYLEYKDGFFYKTNDSFDIVSSNVLYDDSAIYQAIIDSTAAAKQYSDNNDFSGSYHDLVDTPSVSSVWIRANLFREIYFGGDDGTNGKIGINTDDPEYTLDLFSNDNKPMRIRTGGSAKDADIVYENSITGQYWIGGLTHAIYDRFRLEGGGSGSGLQINFNNEFGIGSAPYAGRKLHIAGDFGVGVGNRFYFGTTTTQSRLNAPSSTTFAVENGSIEMARFGRIGTNGSYISILQSSINSTADSRPALRDQDDPDTGVYWRNVDQVGFTSGGVGRLYVTNSSIFLPDYDETRNDGIGVNFLYTNNGEVKSGQIDDLFTANQLTGGNFIGISNGEINNLAPTPFAYGSGNDIFSNMVGRNFGLGTSTPSTTLDVHGDMNFTRKNGTSGTFNLDYGVGSQWTTITPNFTYLDFQTSVGGEIRMNADVFRINSVFKDSDGDVGSANQLLGFNDDGELDVVGNSIAQPYGGLERTSGLIVVSSTTSTKVNMNQVVGTSIGTTPSTSTNDITVDEAGQYRLLVRGFVFDYTTDETLQLEIRVNGVQVEDYKVRGFEDDEIYINYYTELSLSANDDVDIYLDSTSDNDYIYNSFKMTLIKAN